MRFTCVLLLAVPGLLARADAPAKAGPPELDKIHVLMVFDTNDPRPAFNQALQRDRENLLKLLQRSVPGDRYTKKILIDKEVTRKAILDYYKKLQPGPNDGLVFFYGGHGAMDKKTKKHFFQIQSGEVYRDEVLAAMKAKNAPLVVMLSDCCSSLGEVKNPPKESMSLAITRPLLVKIKPVMRSLFFESRGVVDITAASDGTPSWGDRIGGGVFTRTFTSLITDRQFKDLDRDGDKELTWEEFFYGSLRPVTKQAFTTWKEQVAARGEEVDTKEQIPVAFQLGQSRKAKPAKPVAGNTDGPAPPKATKKEQGYAMFGFRNASNLTIAYRYRFEGGEWVTGNKIVKGETKVHYIPLVAGRKLPRVDIDFGEGLGLQHWHSHEWQGPAAPTKDSPQEGYEIYLKNE